MSISITSTEMAGGKSCDKVHLLELCLHQKIKENVSDDMGMSVSLAYRKYNAGMDDVMTYAPTSKNISIDDYLAEATSAPTAEDTTSMLAAVQAIEGATATIINLLGNDGVAEVIA